MSPRAEPDTRNVAGRAWPEPQEGLAEPRKRAGERHEIANSQVADCPVDVPGDLAMARVAADQRGLVHRDQLHEMGLGRGAIAHRLARGRLHRFYPRVYLVGHPVPPLLARETGALLACGPGAILSHATALARWGIVEPPLAMLDVTVVGHRRRSFDDVRVHWVRALPRADVRRRDRMPVTSPARSLLDWAIVATLRELEQAIAEARARGRVREGELEELVGRSTGRRGVAVLRDLLSREAGPAFTRSEAEERLLRLIRKARLPEPECNVRIAGHEVDFLWRSSGLVVEVDGYAFHGSRAAFERDRRRDADLQAAGLTVARLTWRRLVDEPEAVVAQLARAV